ncbi:MAG: response regulator transcription factor, partial [Proteobacteria bacterium]|nr:response regulator transcription factor [Pseudomonadota bacterium]
MIIIVDERKSVLDAFVSRLEGEGIASLGVGADDLRNWITCIAKTDLMVVEGFLVGRCGNRDATCQLIRGQTSAAVVAITDERSLDETLALFAAGVDDVIRMPMHIKEIMARMNAVSRRIAPSEQCTRIGEIGIFADGRDPMV